MRDDDAIRIRHMLDALSNPVLHRLVSLHPFLRHPGEHREISSHGEQDRHVSGFVRGVAGADDDIDVPVEQGDEPDDPLGGEAPQLEIPKLGDVRLRNAEPLRDRGLGEAMLVDQFVQPDGELDAKFPFLRIGEPQILKHIAATGNNDVTLFSCHISPPNEAVFLEARVSSRPDYT